MRGPSAVPELEPLLATPGACEATHILPAAQDGDLALSHFHWKTTASGYHRCQQGARGVALAMMLLAAAAAEVGKTCFAFIFCLALWQADYETLLYHLAEPRCCRPKPNTVCVYIWFMPPPWWLQSKLRLSWTLFVWFGAKEREEVFKWHFQWSPVPLFCAWKPKCSNCDIQPSKKHLIKLITTSGNLTLVLFFGISQVVHNSDTGAFT